MDLGATSSKEQYQRYWTFLLDLGAIGVTFRFSLLVPRRAQANPSDTVDKLERLTKLRDTNVLVQDDY
jgi:hypothetical protein